MENRSGGIFLRGEERLGLSEREAAFEGLGTGKAALRVPEREDVFLGKGFEREMGMDKILYCVLDEYLLGGGKRELKIHVNTKRNGRLCSTVGAGFVFLEFHHNPQAVYILTLDTSTG